MSNTPGKAVEELLNEAYRLSFNGDDRFDGIDLDDEDLRAKLQKIAAIRPLALADVVSADAEISAEFIKRLKSHHDEVVRCRAKRDDLRVFYVINSANNKQTILARDGKCARFFALHSGHIKEEKNGRVLVMNADREAALRTSGEALGRALRTGHPGVVKEVGDNIVLEGAGKVYTPLTIVKREDNL
jgi:hypothetical protein